MKSKQPDKNNPHKIKINFTRILKDTSIFKDPSKIHHALSKGAISTKNFDMERLRKKINLKKSSHYDSIELKPDKKELPFELFNILEKSEKNYDKINKSYISLKQQNKQFMSHWHYTKKILDKLEKKKLIQKELEKNDENNDYKKISKMYDFSERDKIEMDLEKKISQKIFKSNPLIINNNSDLYLYFMNEAQQSPNKSVNPLEQNSSKYLNKVKDFLEYMKIKSDKSLDEFNKTIKMKSCRFIRNKDKKIEEEKNRIYFEQKEKDKKQISETKRMIINTSHLLQELDKNKNYLEDPNYFTFYKKNNIKCLTPCRKTGNKSMNKSSRSDFFIDEKNNFINKNKYDTLRILSSKKDKLSKQLNSLYHESNNKKCKRIRRLKINNLISKYDKYYDESYSKDNNSTMNLNLYNSKISTSQINNNSTHTIFFRKNNSKALHSIKKYFPFYGFTKSSNSNSIAFQPVTIEANKRKESDILSITNKESILNNNNNNNFNSEIDNSNVNIISENENNKNINQEIDNINNNEIKIINTNSNINKDINNNEEIYDKKIKISDLYDEVKNLKNLNNEELKEIDTYINQKDIAYKKKKDTVNILKDAQLVIDEFDINPIARNYFSIKCKENSKIKKFKKINLKMKNLDAKYLKELCHFKAKYGRNDYK